MDVFLDKGEETSKSVESIVNLTPDGKISQIQDFCNFQNRQILETARLPKQLVRVASYDGSGFDQDYKEKIR